MSFKLQLARSVERDDDDDDDEGIVDDDDILRILSCLVLMYLKKRIKIYIYVCILIYLSFDIVLSNPTLHLDFPIKINVNSGNFEK